MSAANPYANQLPAQASLPDVVLSEVEIFRSWFSDLRCKVAILAYAALYRLMVLLRRWNY